MSVKYTPVQWTPSKIFYDLVVLAMVTAYILIYLRLAPGFLDHAKPVDGAILRARAFGTCAFLLITVILCIGPAARFDRRFLPVLYNRRHFGVITFFVALTHAAYVLDWYFNFSPTPRLEALLGSNTSYGQLLGFPFEALGIGALFALAVLAVTSHDFWLSFLTPRLWKALHYALYAAYGLLVGHIALGSLQSESNPTFAIVTAICVTAVCGLHAGAAIREHTLARRATAPGPWHNAGRLDQFEDGRARIALLHNGDRVAVFRRGAHLSAIANACAHQNGPLGEGRLIDGCVTCPWHGFQYRLEDGCSPAPFTEKVPTYNLRIEGDAVMVDITPNLPGTYVAPLEIPGART